MTQDIDRTIARHLGSEATPEEQRLLQAWLAESEQNRRLFAALVSDVTPDTEKAWAAFERHMHQTAAAAPPPRAAARRRATPLLRYAAAVALLMGGAALAWVELGSRRNAAPQIRLVAESAGEVREHTLSDGTCVFLSRGSKLSCVGEYGSGKRELLLEGEAFFEVAAAGSGQLVVHAGQTLIRDVGTAFNVQAYPEDSSVTVLVQRGEVRFYTEADSGVALTAGETASFNKRTHAFRRTPTDANATAYITKTFVFKDKPLGEAVALISRACGVSICVGSAAAAAQVISVAFSGEDVDEMVEVISETMGLQVEKSNGAYRLLLQPVNSAEKNAER
ncbi:MAG: FecR domain-containing protein [Prevotellaceae bacterium]|jgi:ferric-dicitrate binding protein FerR (iron transport regulator)|nr:FecR domain-containing protein [Prevotellaceae bacterium]